MVDDEPYSWPGSTLRPLGRPLKHFQVTVRVAESKDRMAPNEPVDADRFAGSIVDELDLRRLEQNGLTIIPLIFDDAAATNNLFGRDAIGGFNPRPHELNAAARHDERFETVRAEIIQHLKHRLVDALVIRPRRPRMACRMHALSYYFVDLCDAYASMRGRDDFEQ